MSDTIPACSGSWSRSNDDHSRGADLVDVSWIERVVRLEERLSALTARVDNIEAKPDDRLEIIDVLTEIAEVLTEAVDAKGEGDTLAEQIVGAPSSMQKLLRRGVLIGFSAILFIIAKLLESAPAGITLKIGG